MTLRRTEDLLSIMRALRFRESDDRGLRNLIEDSWPALLDFTDRHYLTIPLTIRRDALFPASARERIDSVLNRNRLCYERVRCAYGEISESFHRRGIDFVVLKGLSQWPWYVDRPEHRSQTDIDLYCPQQSIDAARLALLDLGYETVHSDVGTPLDHLPVMIRKTGWRWKGDYYDPERPPSVELHFRFWDSQTEGFDGHDEEGLLRRRERRELNGVIIPALSLRDGLTYSSTHLVRHLLRGDLQLRHAYELAHFLERSAGDDQFWASTENNPAMIEGIAFRVADAWFHPKLHPIAAGIVDALPQVVCQWFDLFAFSPALRHLKPNKDELWLHQCLAADSQTRRRILIRRLFPRKRQRVLLDPHAPPEHSGIRSIRNSLFEAHFLTRRLLHHARALPPVAVSAFRWWRAGSAVS